VSESIPATGEQPTAQEALTETGSPTVQHDQAATDPAVDAGAEGDGQPKPRPIQKRIGELVREREAARREAEYWRQQAAMVQPQQATGQQQTAPADIKPEQFETYEDYLVAKAETRAAARLQQELAQRATAAQQAAEQRQKASVVAQFQTRAEEARSRYEDFDLVVSDPTTPISPVMAEAILRANAGHEVAYYLGRNKQEAARIASLEPLAQAMEIARLEARVGGQKRVSQAPPPPPRLSGSAAPAGDPSQARTYAEYVALRRAQTAKPTR
jgi:hypothetical protein